MEPHIIYLSEEDGEMLHDLLSMPEEEQRFFRMIIEIGHRKIFSEEDFSFFIHYSMKQMAQEESPF